MRSLLYSYFLQEWGYQAWSRAESSPNGLAVIENASEVVIQRLDKNFFRVRFHRLTVPLFDEFMRRTMPDFEEASE
jgi:hypothetical protein